jgi:hypothetical protein
VRESLKRSLGRVRARRFHPQLSDEGFLRALEGGFSTPQDFLAALEGGPRPRFFPDSGERVEVVESVRALCPHAESLTVAAAQRACDHVFDLLGSGPTQLGEPMDWHVDFKTGHRFDSHKYHRDIHPAPYPGGYDVKVPWELSRCQHFVWLGQAYWFTDQEKYAVEFVEQVEDWIAHNPWPWGVNWACTMDVAIRVVNWLWGYHLFRDSPSLTDEFKLNFYKSLLVHGRHIFGNLEDGWLFNGNHYLSDLVGLVYLGLLCPEFREARRWREFALRELEKEAFNQVFQDGVGFEASTAYHRLATELFLSATVLAQLNGHTFSSRYLHRLEKMVEFVMYVTKPNGTAPLLGDNDNGRLHRLKVWDPPEREWVDFRYLLAVGALLFQRADFARAAGDQWEEALWLFGTRARPYGERPDGAGGARPQLGSRAFPDAGWYVLRHQDLYLILDAGSNGQNGMGGHAHNDTLSFELATCGQSWVVDPGTFVYTADHEARNEWRSTALHSTIRVDGEEINRLPLTDLWRLEDRAFPKVNAWRSEESFDLLDVEHRGYARLEPSIVHRRQVFFRKTVPELWVVRDVLTGEGQHLFELFVQMGEVKTHLVAPGVVGMSATRAPRRRFVVVPMGSSALRWSFRESWRAPGYGSKVPSQTLCYEKVAVAPTEFVTVFYPLPKGETFVQAVDRASEVAFPVWQMLAESSREEL